MDRSSATQTAPAAPRFWNVPNSITMGRLVLGFIVFALLGGEWYAPALALFLIASLSDALDGYLARALNQETAVGRQLDPLVDKIIVIGSYVSLLIVPGTGVRPWMVTTIVVRELIVQALRSLIEGRGEPFGARAAGKLKTLFQCVSICAILAALVLRIEPTSPWLWLRDALTWIAILLTVYSGIGYVKLAWPRLKGE